ncbi:MAG TPA: mannitol dehydrogenase family protein, partial [Povalibacter sp.]|nr:mannitol dehydrogenase family protein [Povalibacter sp.]
MMPRLSNTTLSAVKGAALPGYDRSATRIGIVHIGPGAFFRAHQASYVDALLHRDPRWAICAVALKSTGVRDALAPQDGLYVLNELSAESRMRVIGAIREVLVAAEDYEKVFARMAATDTRMVTMTVTEKGYCLNAAGLLDEAHPDIVHDLQSPAQPRSLVGLLVGGLRQRRAAGEKPFAVVSCDNLANNGAVLRKATVAFAAHLDAALARWIENEVAFPRTMVDSITPATDDALRESVANATGVADAWPIKREAFLQWVVEDVPVMREADWASVGVTLATDVSVYDRAKLRLLNGAHSTLAYAGLLRGRETVYDAMTDKVLAGFVETLMREDFAASLGASPGLDVTSYIDALLTRFRNPTIRHLLSQIAWDGSKKLPVRLTGTIVEALNGGRRVDRMAVTIAAWMRFIARQAHNGVPIVDGDAALLTEIGKACNGGASHDVALFAKFEAVLPPAVVANSQFRTALESAYQK